jgi:ketopantoate hydroxymethyltransferase
VEVNSGHVGNLILPPSSLTLQLTFSCNGRPEASASFLKEQTFAENENGVEAARIPCITTNRRLATKVEEELL